MSAHSLHPRDDEDMFGIFRYSNTTNDYEHVELSNDDDVDARGHTLVACDLCRARKVSSMTRYWSLGLVLHV